MNKIFPISKDKLVVYIQLTNKRNFIWNYEQEENLESLSQIIKKELLDKIFSEVGNYTIQNKIKELEFVWCGGEPLLAGNEIFEYIYEKNSWLLDNYIHKPVKWDEDDDKTLIAVKNTVISALLIKDEKIFKILKKLNAKISTTADPLQNFKYSYPEKLNHFEIWANNFIETFNEDLLRDVKIFVHKTHMEEPQKLLKFISDLSLLTNNKIAINVEPFISPVNTQEYTITPKSWSDFLLNLWKTWNASQRALYIHQLFEISQWFSNSIIEFSFNEDKEISFNVFAIDLNGNIFDNSKQMNIGNNPIGNINENTLSDLISPERIGFMKNRIEKLHTNDCKDCPIWSDCFGGNYADNILLGKNPENKNIWCESLLNIYDALFLKEKDLSFSFENLWKPYYRVFPEIIKNLDLKKGAEIGSFLIFNSISILNLSQTSFLYGIQEYKDKFQPFYPYAENFSKEHHKRFKLLNEKPETALQNIEEELDYIFINSEYIKTDNLRELLLLCFSKIKKGGVIAGYDKNKKTYPYLIDLFKDNKINKEKFNVWWIQKP